MVSKVEPCFVESETVDHPRTETEIGIRVFL